jgi:uncharacterized membrane protein YfcA
VIHFAGSTFDTTSIVLIALAAAIGGFLRGFVGFGGALALVPVLSLATGPRVAVAVSSLTGIPAILQLLPEAFRHSDRRQVAPMAISMILAAPLGSLILTSLDQRLMTGVIGVVVMLLALFTWAAPKGPFMCRRSVSVAAGAASGLLQGAGGIGGPPSVAVLMAQGGEPRQVRANVIATTAVMSLFGAITHFFFGLITIESATISLVLLPIFIGCTWFGARFFMLGGSHYFRAAALLILIGIGLAAVTTSVGPMIFGR